MGKVNKEKSWSSSSRAKVRHPKKVVNGQSWSIGKAYQRQVRESARQGEVRQWQKAVNGEFVNEASLPEFLAHTPPRGSSSIVRQ